MPAEVTYFTCCLLCGWGF